MNMATKHEVLKEHLKEWLGCEGDARKRGELAARLAGSLKIHLKSVSRSMRRIQMGGGGRAGGRGRATTYGKDFDAALRRLWDAMGGPCAENMHGDVGEWLPHCLRRPEWRDVGEAVAAQLRAASVSTLKRRIASFRRGDGLGRGRSATVPSPLKGMIPIRKSHEWPGLPPGHAQADSVVHCGDLLTGDVVYSVGLVDHATYWSEYAAQWNKGQLATRRSLELARSRLPFPLAEIHPDTGSEFINHHVLGWATGEGIRMTRSEPHKKNDNMCVEERNGSLVRGHLGYARMDDESLAPLASDVLRAACLLGNHFRSVRRTVSKVRDGAKWVRTVEGDGATPYRRVMASPDVSREDKERLRAAHDGLDPLALSAELGMLKARLAKAMAGLAANRAAGNRHMSDTGASR